RTAAESRAGAAASRGPPRAGIRRVKEQPMSQKLYHVALGSSGIVLSLPIVNVKGTDLALFNPRGKTGLNSGCAQLLAAKFPKDATVILMAAGKAEGLLQATSGPLAFPPSSR